MTYPHADDRLAQRALRRLGSSLLGKYTLKRVIGIGGMAAVYAGVHRNGHSVAVKVLHERLASEPEIERLFRREAQLANRIAHPGVVPVIDDDVTEDGCIFLVMPLLEGETVRARAERDGGTLPLAEVMVIAHAALGALGAAHGEKIVHRDIKPENLFVTLAGEVKVLDFGIGRFFETNDAGASATRSGRAIGTPAFMAPEQALGRTRDIDGRVDVWALGATMFALLSGTNVHAGETCAETTVLAATRPAPLLASAAPNVPRAVCAVVDRALTFDKHDRWESAEAMARGLLDACRASLGVPLDALPPVLARQLDTLDGVEAQRTFLPSSEPTGATLPTGLAPTRPASGESPVAPRRAPHRLALGAGVALMVAAAMPFVFHGASAKSPSPGAPSRETGVASEPRPGEGTLSALAGPVIAEAGLSPYRAAIRAWLDASGANARWTLETATNAAPDFAAAHLWYVLAADYVEADVREHYASAVRYRDSLTERQRQVLEALAPSMADPSDLGATAFRLARLSDERPEDVELLLVLASRYNRLGDAKRGLETIDRVLGNPAPPGLAYRLRASLVSRSNDAQATREALHACLDRSPTGDDCLYTLWALEAGEGKCQEIEPLCRRLVADSPKSAFPYVCFADALSSTGGSEQAVRFAFEKREQLSSAPEKASANDETTLAIWEGRLSEAEPLAARWQTSVADADETSASSTVYAVRVQLAAELGDKARAAKLVNEFKAASRSWPESNFVDVDALYLGLASAVGALPEAERQRLRSSLIAAIAAAPSYGAPSRRWNNAYAVTSWTPDEAQEALARMPAEGINPPQFRNAYDDYNFGRLYALAGRPEEAKRFFARAAASCSLEGELPRTRAKVELAKLSVDDKPRACELYADVIHHWAKTPRAVSVVAAVHGALALHCN